MGVVEKRTGHGLEQDLHHGVSARHHISLDPRHILSQGLWHADRLTIVTARLRIKGTRQGVPFDRRLWFSDAYVRTPAGCRYFLGQASLLLPDSPSSQSRTE